MNEYFDNEIYKVIDVAIEIGGNSTTAYERFALNAWDFHKNNGR